jgi:phosphate transport system permease protein
VDTTPSDTHPLLTGTGNLRRRRRVNRLLELAAWSGALIAVAILFGVVASVFVKGVGAISLDFLTKVPAAFGESGGGISNAIIGTAVLVGLATLIAVPVGILVAIYTSEFAGSRPAFVVRYMLDILNGVPTIVTGLFVFGILVVGHQQSGFAGSVALAIIMLPLVARSAHEVLALVPASVKEAGLALGASRWRTVVSVVLPTAFTGLLTGALLAVARAAGETAPLLFTTSIFPDLVQTDPSHALPNIPVTIFRYSESPDPALHEQAWGAALILILFVLAISIVARALSARTRRRLGAAR